MAEKQSNSMEKIFGAIGAVVGLMLAVFALLQAILPTSLAQPIGTAVAGLILTWALVLAHRWTWDKAGLIWLIISFIFMGLYLFISQPATLVGYVQKDDGTPLAAITLIITNSTGVEQKAVTDKDGKFEVNGVPEGRYTITISGQPKYSGEIPTGLQRIFAPKISAGTLSIQIAGLPSPVPSATIIPTQIANISTNTPILTATLNASYTATAVPTQVPTYTSAPTITISPTPPSTATSTMTDTPIPTIAPTATNLLFEANFEDGKANDFRDITGKWQVVDDGTGNKVFEASNMDATIWPGAVFGPASFGDYTVEYRVKLINCNLSPPSASCMLWLSFRENSQGAYVFDFTPGAHSAEVSFADIQGGAWQNLEQQKGIAAFDFQKNIWYALRVDAYGTAIKTYVNGELLFAVNDIRLKNGGLSLHTGPNTTAQFDDFRVSKLPPQ